jgi:glyoxylase-like metal-dependent hydrolase (beta-lactamase superfamily II)
MQTGELMLDAQTARREPFPADGNGPMEVAPNCWLVGHRNPHALLQCNTYLRIYDGKSPERVCIDPGSQFDYSVIEANIGQLIGDMSQVDAFTLNHQDPDVVGNSGYFCDANACIRAIVTEDVWRLVQHLLFKPGKVEFANPARATLNVAGEANRLRPVPTPFCHFRGAMAFYDPELRTLFSGDLFGGLNQLGRVHLFAEEADWAGIAQFHQIYMPTREVLRYAVRQIRALKPTVEIIAPQHGHVIAGDLVPLFLERMSELLVGSDLLAMELDEAYLEGYRSVLNRLIARAEQSMERGEIVKLLESRVVGDDLGRLVTIAGGEIELKREGYSAVVKVLNRLALGESMEFANTLRSEVLSACIDQKLPIPPIGAGIEG